MFEKTSERQMINKISKERLNIMIDITYVKKYLYFPSILWIYYNFKKIHNLKNKKKIP